MPDNFSLMEGWKKNRKISKNYVVQKHLLIHKGIEIVQKEGIGNGVPICNPLSDLPHDYPNPFPWRSSENCLIISEL